MNTTKPSGLPTCSNQQVCTVQALQRDFSDRGWICSSRMGPAHKLASHMHKWHCINQFAECNWPPHIHSNLVCPVPAPRWTSAVTQTSPIHAQIALCKSLCAVQLSVYGLLKRWKKGLSEGGGWGSPPLYNYPRNRLGTPQRAGDWISSLMCLI